MKCNYCNKETEWVSNKEIYGSAYGKSHMIYLCRDCDAYVGCHQNTRKSLGTLANKELREKRKEVKSLFIQKFMKGDWKNGSGKKNGYNFLNKLFGKNYHFGESTLEELNIINQSINQIP